MKKRIIIVTILFLVIVTLQCIFNIKTKAEKCNTYLSNLTIQEYVNNKFGNIRVDGCEYLYNLDESPDYIYIEFEEEGYAILSSSTLDVMEYSYSGRIPYEDSTKKYYAGPTSYLKKENNTFKNIETNEVISSEDTINIISTSKEVLRSSNNSKSSTLIKNINDEVGLSSINNSNDRSSSTNSNGQTIIGGGLGPGAIYINNAEYFIIGPYHGHNYTGTCTAVAIQLLLTYHNYYSDRRIIDENYLFDDEDCPNHCTNPMEMTSKILGSRGESDITDYESNSFFRKVINAINAINDSNETYKPKEALESLINENVNFGSVYYCNNVSTLTSEITGEIDNNMPTYISLRTGTDGRHAVVGYGYQTLNNSGAEEDGEFGYIVHYGHRSEGMNNVWINNNWCYNCMKVIISNPHVHSYGTPSGDYYDAKCTICGHRTSIYPFKTTQNNGELTITGTLNSIQGDVTIPSYINGYPVAHIAPLAFSNNTQITSIKIPNTVATIGFGAFSKCSNIKKMILPFVGNSPLSTGSSSYFGYIFGSAHLDGDGTTPVIQNTTTYYIPSSLEEVEIRYTYAIQSHAFENCSMIKHITIPFGLTSINSYTFNGCTHLKSINIPRTVTSIGTYAFYNCGNTAGITLHLEIPYSVSSVGNNAFSTNIDLSWNYNPNYKISSLNLLTVLDKVSVSKYVTSIGNFAFANCTSLKKVDIERNVSSIASNAFTGCTSLNTVKWYYDGSRTASSLGTSFTNVLTDVEVIDEVQSIPSLAFNNCINLTNVSISKSVSSIPSNAFNGCTSLNTVLWYYDGSRTASSLGTTFTNLLTYIKVVDDVESISDTAFLNCYNVNHVSISKSVSSIDCDVFSDCVPIQTFTWHYNPNYTATNLHIAGYITNVVIPKNDASGNTITSIGINAFKNCTKLRSVEYNGSITSIGASAFEGCTSLESITLPTTLTSIGSGAFKGCTLLEEIIIPSLVPSIGYETFKNCTSLETVTINRAHKPLTTLGTNAFQGCSSLNEIIVPRDRIADYKNDWTSYGSIIIPNSTEYDLFNINSSSNISTSVYLYAGYNKLYKLNVSNQDAYLLSITSGTGVVISLYNSSFVLMGNPSSTIEQVLLSGHTYYLSVEHSNVFDHGSVTFNIKKDPNHIHSYDDYIWNSYTQHQKKCSCGVSGGYEPHVVEQGSYLPGQQYATCLLCGGLASIGFVGSNGVQSLPHTINGSIILPNGVIVLASVDVEDYFDGELIFIYQDIE